MKGLSNLRITLLSFLATLLGSVVVGCSAGGAALPEPTAEVGGDQELDGSEWALSALGGEEPLAGTRITLQFDGTSIGGNAGCNSYGAEVGGVSEGRFDVDEVSRTAQACVEPAGVMEQEEAYLQALVSSSGYRLDEDSLTLLDEAGETRLVFSRKEETAADPGELVGSAWRLTTYNRDALAVRRPITLIFGQSRFWGHSECRSYVGRYQATGDDIVFPSVSMLGEPCADEQLFLLESGDYQLQEGRLVLTGERGDTFSYEALSAADAGDLVDGQWRLLAFVGPGETPAAIQEPLAGTGASASFDAGGTVNGGTACNAYTASYEVAADMLQITIGGVTEAYCEEPAGAMEQEGKYLSWLAEVRRFQIGGGLLWLDVGDDRALLFERESSTRALPARWRPRQARFVG